MRQAPGDLPGHLEGCGERGRWNSYLRLPPNAAPPQTHPLCLNVPRHRGRHTRRCSPVHCGAVHTTPKKPLKRDSGKAPNRGGSGGLPRPRRAPAAAADVRDWSSLSNNGKVHSKLWQVLCLSVLGQLVPVGLPFPSPPPTAERWPGPQGHTW